MMVVICMWWRRTDRLLLQYAAAEPVNRMPWKKRQHNKLNIIYKNIFDIQKFMDCIYNMPALWDKTTKEYADKNCREISWAE